MIHIIGDSHSLCFGSCSEVITHWLGAYTAFNLWKKNEQIQRTLSTIPDADFVLFLFGEIDCRIHIYNSSMKYGVHPKTLIEMTGHNYITYLQQNIRREFKVLAVPPQGWANNEYKYSFYTDREIRQTYTHNLNYYLQQNLGNSFFNIWPEYSLWDIADFKQDRVHLKNEVVQYYWERSQSPV